LTPRIHGKNQTLERIVEAAVQLFSRQGFSGSSTREIARLADVNEVTVFRYFPRKKELFWAALECRLNLIRLDRELQSRLANDDDPEKVLSMVFEFLVGIMLRQPELMRLLYFSMLELGSGSDRVYRKQLRPVFGAITGYLERCVERGVIRKVDPFVTALGFVGTVMAHQSMYEMLTGTELPYRTMDDAISAYSEFWLNALAPTGRHSAIAKTGLATAASRDTRN
jgi:AcrR family transcriptional regulator